eukprot:10079607-Heterocapsa_arctica.AAC.1
MSVAKMNEAGNDVNPRGDNPHIENTKSGQITALRREEKTFILDLWIKHPLETYLDLERLKAGPKAVKFETTP